LVHGTTALKLINLEINICDIESTVKLNAMARISSDEQQVKRAPRNTAAAKARKLAEPASTTASTASTVVG
jgi:hypothetical protein